MKAIYMYQLEDRKTFTSEDEPTQMDELCCHEGTLRIFRIFFDIQLCYIEELVDDECNMRWISVQKSEIRQQRYNAVDNPFHFPKEEQ